MTNQHIKVVGMDPSMRNWGVAVGLLDTDSMKITIQELKVVSPKDVTTKTVRQNTKDIHVAHQHYSTLYPILNRCSVSFVEAPVGSQNAAAMKAYGLCVGVLGSLSAHLTPPYELTAKQVKAVSGNDSASKKQMISWAMKEHPEAPWPMKTIKGVPSPIEGMAEHMADAVATIHAGILTPEFRQLLPFIKQTLQKEIQCELR